MLSKTLTQNHNLNTSESSRIYLFEQGMLSEDEIAQEIVPLFKRFDKFAKSKLRILSDLKELSDDVPDILLSTFQNGNPAKITGLAIPISIHDKMIEELTQLGYSFK